MDQASIPNRSVAVSVIQFLVDLVIGAIQMMDSWKLDGHRQPTCLRIQFLVQHRLRRTPTHFNKDIAKSKYHLMGFQAI
jgi:arginine decarboxylase-like protein|tara:strand:- start:710 stop:946 length:237 start_codon:yes stop_codon:yes gene_type:complete